MATWITHLMIADNIIKEIPTLDRLGFCVGNIAPDCNIENEDWTSFTPPREVTHWMSKTRKVLSDCDLFYEEYIVKRKNEIKSQKQYSFLLGYYAHLITDAAFQAFIRNEKRVKDTWDRIKSNAFLKEQAKGYPENWDSVKKLISKEKRMNEIDTIEAEYLKEHPDSGYITEILPLTEFPDYIDYMPHGCIVRKIRIMSYLPEVDSNMIPIAISKEEYHAFVRDTTVLVINKWKEKEQLKSASSPKMAR